MFLQHPADDAGANLQEILACCSVVCWELEDEFGGRVVIILGLDARPGLVQFEEAADRTKRLISRGNTGETQPYKAAVPLV
jgi:hypothetical protein